MSTTDIVLELSRIGRELDQLSREIERRDADAVQAWHVHRREYARVFLASQGTGTQEDRKQAAIQAVEEHRLSAESADQILRAARDRIRVLRDRLEIGRSLNAARRSEFAAEAVGQT